MVNKGNQYAFLFLSDGKPAQSSSQRHSPSLRPTRVWCQQLQIFKVGTVWTVNVQGLAFGHTECFILPRGKCLLRKTHFHSWEFYLRVDLSLRLSCTYYFIPADMPRHELGHCHCKVRLPDRLQEDHTTE